MHDKILEGYTNDFANQFGFPDATSADIFGHFANYCVLSKLTAESVDLDEVDVDGSDDTGIDGLAILVDGHVVTTAEDVDFFRDTLHRLDVEFVFVQAKSGSHFSAASIGTFLFGVKAFFDDASTMPANPAVAAARVLKNYIYSLSIHMERSPKCTMAYVCSGEWHDDVTLKARVDAEVEALRRTNLFSTISFAPVDAEKLKQLYRELRNKVVAEVSFEKHTILPAIGGVTEAYLGILPCREYLKLIVGGDGDIQRGLFYDNVRDFQGNNPVNSEIAATVTHPSGSSQFVLLNNGVTIVARSISKVGAKFKLTDYQIVNGCQTSHVLYQNRDKPLDNVNVPVKVIVTDDPDITNSVIRATNRQTEVKPEAFESLSPFHRTLEEFYASFGRDSGNRLYYERRSKQFASLPVKPHDIISLAAQAKAFLAVFLDEPHSTHRYYGELLDANRGRMFGEDHRPYPYYAAAYGVTRVEDLFRLRVLPSHSRRFKYHVVMLMRLAVVGKTMPSLSSKKMDEYCEKFCAVLRDDNRLREAAILSAGQIDGALNAFTGDRTLAPRLRTFTLQLMPTLAARPTGRVKNFNLERGFGFIETQESGDVFVHFTAIKGTAHRYLRAGETVEFDLIKTDRGPQAQNVNLLTASA